MAIVYSGVVALRKESVDRNRIFRLPRSGTARSLSARRAWIEIFLLVLVFGMPTSLSARRAWIEICGGTAVIAFLSVALRKESVDRNVKA